MNKEATISKRILEQVERVFQCHGLLPMAISRQVPSFDKFTIRRSNVLNQGFKKEIKFCTKSINLPVSTLADLIIDKNGVLLKRCENLLIPLSRLISRFKMNSMRSYSILQKQHHLDDVFIKNKKLNRFRIFYNLVQDSASLESHIDIYSSVYQAEMMVVMLSIFAKFTPYLSHSLQLSISHISIVDIIAHLCKISPNSPRYEALFLLVGSKKT